MADHFHVWLRSGRVFTMVTTAYRTRQAAQKEATKRRPDRSARMVLTCAACPPSARSKRPPIRWARVAAALGVEVSALKAAWDLETKRRQHERP